jgi:hypothetical protein
MPNDLKGVKMIVPSSRVNPQSYYYNGSFDARVALRRDTTLPIFKSDSIFSFGSGNDNGQVDFYTSSGYNPSKVRPLDHSRYVVQKNMQDNKDWTNIECTLYANVKSVLDSKGRIIWRVRTGQDRQKSGDCESCGYEAELNVLGNVRFVKRQYCGASQYRPYVHATGDIEERWIGFKFIVFNNEKSGYANLEVWIDENDSNDWVPKVSFTDTGFGNGLGTGCNGAPNQIISWGGPIVSLLWQTDGSMSESVEFKNLSIREVDVNGSFSGQEGL